VPLDPGERDELATRLEAYATSRDPALRDEIVRSQLGLVEYLAGRFAHRGEPREDLVQVGALALVKAVDRFEPARGVSFASFATQTILGELKRHFRDRGWALKTPRRLKELFLAASQANAELTQRLGRSPRIAEIAELVSATEEEVLEALEAGQGYRTASLDAPGEAGEQPLGERLGSLPEEFATAEDRSALRPLLAQLPERERRILNLRFFAGMTQAEIASRLGISQMHVSRLLARSLGQLRSLAAAEGQPRGARAAEPAGDRSSPGALPPA
jgi:RNA polymerase sigma-B factor